MSTSSETLYWASVRDDFLVFVQQAFAFLYPGKTFDENWHIEAIIHHAMRCVAGELPRLIINLPPRQLKSFIISIALPAFVIGRDPTAKLICVSYSEDLAKSLARDFRRIVDSTWFQNVFPEVKRAKSTELEFVTDQGGFRLATSVGGTLTGRGGDIMIVDDPIKPQDALSDSLRNSANEWFRSTLLSRLDDKRYSILLIVMQRLHVNDLTGFVEAAGGFFKLSLPAIAERDETIDIRDGVAYKRLEGEALHEEREPIAILEGIRNQMGTANFAAQYQQHPEIPEGAMFKRAWFKFINKLPQPLPEGHYFVSIDTALSTAESADYSALTLIYADRNGYVICHAERGHWDYEELKRRAHSYIERFGRDNVDFIVEATGAGISLISYLRKNLLHCFSYFPKDGKQTRAAYALPTIHEGRVFILNQPGKNAWIEPYLNEFLTFPHGRFDDQVDSLVQFIIWAEKRFNPQTRIWFA
ncbi:terminase [Propionivibrio dicarboxylicus]|uniref:Phage uncharacterized protein (Putative large terminase), C-terminal domain-containing protein n=1 Tax=Propionivibrio dicarboxylicus TaxID=83767 RepID=A0A1G7Z2P0_9RHOO|nr:terminase [Propionivibrio dicarboxylicus]SDH03041.1 phage uncharacterized protein (putative large terminase), C-terminal domain-containing protein [Propionivibrio dicarboxylicus]